MKTKLTEAHGEVRTLRERNAALQAEAEAASAHVATLSSMARTVTSSDGLDTGLGEQLAEARAELERLSRRDAGQSPLGAVLRHDGSPMGAQSSWVPTAAAIASAIHASASPAMIIHGGAHKGGWGSRSAAKEFVDRWFEHAHDMIGASVHVTTREERKAWDETAAKLEQWMEGVTARTFTKVGTDEELAVRFPSQFQDDPSTTSLGISLGLGRECLWHVSGA